jgi:short-subunit dehydrogenase
VDVLVNNAGVGDQELFDRTDWNRTRQVLHTNVIATVQLTEAPSAAGTDAPGARAGKVRG